MERTFKLKGVINLKFTADLETTTDENDCRVWLWGVCEIGNVSNFIYGRYLDDFFKTFLETPFNKTVYFHNLKFDGEFLFHYLFENGYKLIKDKKDKSDKTFTTLISDTGLFYSIEIYFKVGNKQVHKCTILDSYKILPFSIDSIAKSFNLPLLKLDIDYRMHRPIDYIPTNEEIKYLQNDVTIPAMALNTLFEQGLTKMTQGSNALHDYKMLVTKKNFDKWFPPPDYETDFEIRQSYKGGFTYVNPKYQGLDIGEGIVLDVNSLYPSVMYYNMLPYGKEIYFNGEYKDNVLYPLYIQMFKCGFELKENHIPTLQLKNSLAFIPTDYLTSSKGEIVTLCMTSIDLDLFKKHYDLYDIVYIGGYMYKATDKLFKKYIDKWNDVKVESKKDSNFGMYTLAKLMLNALYGKFSLNPNVRSKYPYMVNGIIKYELGERETRTPLYIPVGTFITSYARYKTITSAQSVYDRFLYADTDSLHLIGTDLPKQLNIHNTKLGCWSIDSQFIRARFIRQKTYLETERVDNKRYEIMEDEEKTRCYELNGEKVIDKITCSGMPRECYIYVNWDNFKIGSTYNGKKRPKHVKGGLILEETDFSIRG